MNVPDKLPHEDSLPVLFQEYADQVDTMAAAAIAVRSLQDTIWEQDYLPSRTEKQEIWEALANGLQAYEPRSIRYETNAEDNVKRQSMQGALFTEWRLIGQISTGSTVLEAQADIEMISRVPIEMDAAVSTAHHLAAGTVVLGDKAGSEIELLGVAVRPLPKRRFQRQHYEMPVDELRTAMVDIAHQHASELSGRVTLSAYGIDNSERVLCEFDGVRKDDILVRPEPLQPERSKLYAYEYQQQGEEAVTELLKSESGPPSLFGIRVGYAPASQPFEAIETATSIIALGHEDNP